MHRAVSVLSMQSGLVHTKRSGHRKEVKSMQGGLVNAKEVWSIQGGLTCVRGPRGSD